VKKDNFEKETDKIMDITKNNKGAYQKSFVLIVKKYIMAGLIQKYVRIVAVF